MLAAALRAPLAAELLAPRLTGRDGRYDPAGDHAACRRRWRYRGGWLNADPLAPPDHHPAVSRS